jgi:hypothetical protein
VHQQGDLGLLNSKNLGNFGLGHFPGLENGMDLQDKQETPLLKAIPFSIERVSNSLL